MLLADRAWISRSLKVMMKAGLTRRIQHRADSCKNLVSLTEKGEHMLRVITPIALTGDRHLLGGVDKEKMHEVLDALRARAA